MSLVTSDFNALLHEPGLRSIAENSIKEQPVFFKQIFKVEKAPKGQRYLEWAYMAGVGLIPEEIGELSPSAQLDGGLSDKIRYRWSWRRAKFLYTQRAAEFDRYNTLKRMAASMTPAMLKTLDLLAHQHLNNALTTGKVGGWDRKILGATNHSLIKTSSTYSNVTVPMAASMGLLRVIDRYGANIPDEYGFSTPSTRVRIVVPREDITTWEQLLNSSTEVGQPNSAVINPFKGKYELIPDPYLDGSVLTAVVLYDDAELQWFDYDAVSTQLRMENDRDVPQMVYQVRWGGASGWNDARRILIIPAA